MSKHELRTLGGVGDDEDLSDIGDVGDVSEHGEIDMFGLDEFGQPAGSDSMWGAVIGGGLGTGAAIITRAMTKPTSRFHNMSELVGLAAAGVAGGVMMAFGPSRRMGMAAIATGLVTNGLRQVESLLFPAKFDVEEARKLVAAADAAATKKASATDAGKLTTTPPAEEPQAGYGGWGGVVMDPTAYIKPFQGQGQFGQDIDVHELGDGFGIATIEPGFAVQEPGGFGEAVIDAAYPIPGSIHGNFGQARPELVGPPTLANAGDYGMSDNPAVSQTAILGGPAVSGLGAHYGATLYGPGNGG